MAQLFSMLIDHNSGNQKGTCRKHRMDPAKKAACQPTQISGSGPQAVWIDHNYQRKKKIPEDQQFQAVPKGYRPARTPKVTAIPFPPFAFPPNRG